MLASHQPRAGGQWHHTGRTEAAVRHVLNATVCVGRYSADCGAPIVGIPAKLLSTGLCPRERERAAVTLSLLRRCGSTCRRL